jgi:hypothetical protein
VSLRIGRGDTARLFSEGQSDVCLIPFYSPQQTSGQGTLVYDQNWVLLFNPEGFIGRDADLRAAFAGTPNMVGLAERLPKTAALSRGIVPSYATMFGGLYRQLAGAPHSVYAVEDPRGRMCEALERLGVENLPATTLLVSNFLPGPNIGAGMQRDWMDNLLVHVNMEQLPYETLLARVQSGLFDMAIVPITAHAVMPEDYLEQLLPKTAEAAETDGPDGLSADGQGAPGANGANSDARATGESLGTPEYLSGALLQEARRQSDPVKAAQNCLAMEQRLIDSFMVLPLFESPSLFIQREGVTGVVYTAASRAIYFGGAVCAS